ncbi:TIGR03086 family metal-binding protein [Streptomyces oceani]|uniref:Mycothiol-dependent maleylpyruvate isomerase metal-binding domain-containing protein n=1 Tax=Streptomyces oceani TaxID=1075402 RepID=A0A1E7JZI5_9ACTN|nr:TIGR03086 family metal-binding protein [Streptomyces oceani]OEU97084.1 hypothetical protein AN216_17135 [Streptomyces oceani]
MTDISARYRQLSDAFTRQVEAVPPRRWDDPSPCADWTARQVLDHVIETQHRTAGYVSRDLPGPPDPTSADAPVGDPADAPGDAPADDPVAAWRAARDAMRRLLEDPATARLEFDGMLGRTSLERAVDDFVCFDLVVHAWDIARATGGDERMDLTEVRRLRAQAEGFGAAFRGPGGFGPEIAAPEGAGEQERLLAYLGRRP